MVIYKITNLINNKVYIGQTIRKAETRWASHKKGALTEPKLHIQFAMRKYGIDNFTFEVIDTAESIEELNLKEVYWIEFYNSIEEGYNLKPGGDFNPMKDAACKARHDAIMRSPEVRGKISRTMKAVKAKGISEETRRKLSEAAKGNKKYLGKKRPQYAIDAASKAKYKPVYCIDESGQVVAEFESLIAADYWWWYDRGYQPSISGYKGLSNVIKRSNTHSKYIDGLKWYYGKVGDVNE